MRGFETELLTRGEKIVQRLCRYLPEQKDKQLVTLADLSRDTNSSPNDILNLFEIHGIVPETWTAPDVYLIEAILEALTRHEVSARFNR